MLAPALALLLLTSPSTDEDLEEPRLVLLPMGAPDPQVVKAIAARLERTLRVTVTVAQPEPMPKEAYHAPRSRWRADTILDVVGAQARPGDKVAVITDRPISTTKGAIADWGIAGLGELPGRTCVFSTYLYRGIAKKDRARYVRYVEDLALHEVGHTLGLPHCSDDTCLMADAKGNALRSAAQSSGRYCARCRARAHAWLREEPGT